MPLPRGELAWLRLALDVIPAYVASEGAVIWPEVEARLGEGPWITDQYDPTFPLNSGVNPHILGQARDLLEGDGSLVREEVVLSRRPVTAWLDGPGLASRAATRIRRAASSKRRLYRTYLGWSGNPALCGQAAEAVVDRSLTELAGRYVWLPEGHQAGQIRTLQGRELRVGGPLDAAGFAALNPRNPADGFVPFAVEVKNVRGVLYPWSHETWDLLSKLADFPDVLPLLIARRIHFTTYRFFKDVGAVGCDARQQWFHDRGTTRASIDRAAFARVRETFGFTDAVLLPDLAAQPVVTNFFSSTLYKTSAGSSLLARQSARWRDAAQILAGFEDLRREDLSGLERRELMAQVGEAVADAGLMDSAGWAPSRLNHDEDDEDDR